MQGLKLSSKIIILIVSGLILVLALLSLKTYFNQNAMYKKVQGYRYLFGLSLSNSTNSRNVKLIEDIESSKDNDINFIIKEARNDAERQCEDITELERYGVDILVVSPINEEIVKNTLRELSKKVKIIILDDSSFLDCSTAFIGYNNYEAGKQLAKILNVKGRAEDGLLLISGEKIDCVNREREEGFLDNLESGLLNELTILEGNRNRDDAENIMKYYLVSGKKAQDVVALDDEMVYGAYLGARKLRESGIDFYGINGFNGENKGKDLEKRGIIQKTIQFENMYKSIIDIGLKILENKEFDAYNLLEIQE